jgi:hypothetical protein
MQAREGTADASSCVVMKLALNVTLQAAKENATAIVQDRHVDTWLN